jgi:hypothetical protein
MGRMVMFVDCWVAGGEGKKSKNTKQKGTGKKTLQQGA